MITGDLHEPILLVQTILLLQDEGDITGLFTYVINLISDTKVCSVCTHLYYDSGQSHQGTESIGIDHTLDHLMHQEAAAEVGVTVGV